MNSMYNQRRLQPKPPDKGSFPLDHSGVCKTAMTEYMTCLNSTDMTNTECRELSKAYLKCRMDHNLMMKEDWKYLGYQEDAQGTSPNSTTNSSTSSTNNTGQHT